MGAPHGSLEVPRIRRRPAHARRMWSISIRCVESHRRGGRCRPNRPCRCGSGSGGNRRVLRRRSGASLHSRLRLRRRSGVVAGVRVDFRRRRGVRRTHGVLRRRSAVRLRLLRRRSWRGVCLRVRAPTAAARSARWPGRVVAVEPLLDQASDELPQRHARVHVREQPPELLQPLLALRVDRRLQLVAAVAERAHPVGRRRQLRVQVGQHPADLPGALAGRLFDQLPPPHRIEHQRRRHRLGGEQRYGRRGVCRRIVLCRRPAAGVPAAADPAGAIAAVPEIDPRRRCRSNAHCNSAAALSVSEPSRNPSRACG